MSAQENSPVRIGIIGCGRATQTLHLPALRFVPEAEVVALSDPDADALTAAAQLANVSNCEADYRSVLDMPSVEAVAICAPTQFHAKIARDALDAGKHLFVEKPLALTLEDCDALIEKAAGLPLKVMLGFNTRWHRLARQARTLVQQGRIGHPDVIQSVHTSFHDSLPKWRQRRDSGGGVLLEMAVHQFDLWRYLLGSEVEEISAHSRSGTWHDESATVTAKLSCGTLAAATFAERTTQNNYTEIHGETGSIRIAFYQFDGLKITTPSQIPGSISSRLGDMTRFIKGLPSAIPTLKKGGEWNLSYVEELRHFTDSIRKSVSVECGLEEGRRALAIALAAIQSADSGKSILLNSNFDN